MGSFHTALPSGGVLPPAGRRNYPTILLRQIVGNFAEYNRLGIFAFAGSRLRLGLWSLLDITGRSKRKTIPARGGCGTFPEKA
jgi:hypothetical protein